MSSDPRLVVPGHPHHLQARRQFSDDDDRRRWLADLVHGIESSHCLLHQVTLMDDHVHLIVTPPRDGSLAVLMKRERYRATLIENERQWLWTTLRNDASAYRAGLVPSPVEHSWSTGPLHAGRRGSRVSPWIWTPAPWYMRLARSANSRAAIYASLIDRSDEESDDNDEDTTAVFRPDGTAVRVR